ncbi:hypothetical protein NW752_010400 [Fusarium irregulare]|uniref:Uncharacterized protein n=1 Tax=Fusarium irregulare TaxID=2494466 RepID=A0A9W8U5Y6_9HYPO|nr:hypothetical protein NW752_010400 [Fusarium irregulare]KAJ4008038.1 hypothetical protein NW766_009853 [Fusarium irregulare]
MYFLSEHEPNIETLTVAQEVPSIGLIMQGPGNESFLLPFSGMPSQLHLPNAHSLTYQGADEPDQPRVRVRLNINSGPIDTFPLVTHG